MGAQPLVHGPQQPAELLLSDVHVLDPRSGLEGPHAHVVGAIQAGPRVEHVRV